MNCRQSLEDYISAIDACSATRQIHLAIRNHIEPKGFRYFLYALLFSPSGPLRKPLYITTCPSEWVQKYISHGYARDDVSVHPAVSSFRPFLWSERLHRRKLTQAQRVILGEATDFGLRSGGSIPLHGPGGAAATFAVASDMPEQQFAGLFLSQRHELQIVAAYAHERMLQIGLKDPQQRALKLTPREIEVITWSARGKTAWEIAEILSLSEDTIRDHIRNACRKLNTRNKTHAIAVAMTLGVILL